VLETTRHFVNVLWRHHITSVLWHCWTDLKEIVLHQSLEEASASVNQRLQHHCISGPYGTMQMLLLLLGRIAILRM